jgi:hypothetical protein
MRKQIIRIVLLLALLCPSVSSVRAVTGRSTGWGWCAICGRDMPPSHDFTHGAGSSGGYNAANDPFVQTMTPLMGAFFNGFGQGMANSMFSDPAADARQQALRQEQQRRQEEEAQRRQSEETRLRQITHERLMKSLKLTTTAGTGLRLKSLDDDEFDGAGRTLSGGAGAAVGSDVVDLRPAGTAFFGTGGGGESVAFDDTSNDTSVVDLRDYQRARDLAQAAYGAAPADRELLLSEAERAADGDNTVVLDPNAKTLPVDAAKYRSFRTTNQAYQGAAHDLSAAQSRLNLAERRVTAMSQAIRRLEQDLDKLTASGADAAAIAEKRRLLEEARKALAACEAERSAARKEVETAQSARDLMKWSRRQELVVSGGGGWEPLPQEQEQNLSKLQRIYGRQTVPPVPEIPGWVARAEAGRHALQQVDRLDGMVAACPEENKATAEIQLDRVRHKAEMMDYYDRVMNAQRLERIESMKQLQEIKTQAAGKIGSFASESVSTVESALGDFRTEAEQLLKDPAWQKANIALMLNEKMESSHDLTTELLAVKEAIKTGSMDPQTQSKVMERASMWSLDLIKATEALQKTDPELAKRLLGRTGFWVKAGYGIARTTDCTMDLVQLNSDATLQADALANSAEHSKRLQQMYQRQVDGFHEESRRLDAMLGQTASAARQDQR